MATTPATDDATLVTLSLRGDHAAFGRLYDRYARFVAAVLHGAATDEAQADDLRQETFLRAYRLLPRLREPARFGGWVAGIARQISREARRSRRRSRLVAVPVPDRPAADPEAFPDETERLLAAVAQLPERERLAVHAFYLDGGGRERVASILGLSRSGVYHVLRRALGRLARGLGDDLTSSEVEP